MRANGDDPSERFEDEIATRGGGGGIGETDDEDDEMAARGEGDKSDARREENGSGRDGDGDGDGDQTDSEEEGSSSGWDDDSYQESSSSSSFSGVDDGSLSASSSSGDESSDASSSAGSNRTGPLAESSRDGLSRLPVVRPSRRRPSDASGLVRRRRRGNSENPPQCRHREDEDEVRRGSRRSSGGRRRRKRPDTDDNWFVKYLCCRTRKRSTRALVVSFAVWVLAQCYYFYHHASPALDFVLEPEGSADGQQPLHLGRGPSGRERKRAAAQNKHPGDVTIEHRDLYRRRTREEMERLRRQRTQEAREALGAGGISEEFEPDGYRNDRGGKPKKVNNSRRNKKNKKSRDSEGNTRAERIREGCSALEWHSYHFPNCNEIHEIDLRATMTHRTARRRRGSVDAEGKEEDDGGEGSGTADDPPRRRHRLEEHDASSPWGFVGAGLWRDVFSCDPRGEAASLEANDGASAPPSPPAVLKIMKSEHPYDQRNFQRHRRDALVMERLSSSRHLVPIYGHCADTVLTKAASHTLDDVIYAREHERVKKWSPNGGFRTKAPLESWMGRGPDGEPLATRESGEGRIRLALGVFRGLADLHEGDASSNRDGGWLPVVHADLQSKQYLVDAVTGRVYLNDFNRCRFMTKRDVRPGGGNATAANETVGDNGSSENGTAVPLDRCPIYIPTAPGASRSPEEYHLAPLTEKLDVYSAGNILYGIITGLRPWDGDRGKHIKESIKRGEHPMVNQTIREATGTVDAGLANLLDKVYEKDPGKRASAKEVVAELERLLDNELKRKRKTAPS